MYGTTTINGKLECSAVLTILYQDEYPNPGILVLGDCLYHALCDATGDHGAAGGLPHVICGQAKITARYCLSPSRLFALVLYDVSLYSFVPSGSNAEFSGTLPNGAKTEVELFADGPCPIIRFPGRRDLAMAVDIGTFCNLQWRVESLTDENNTSVSRDEIQRNLFCKIEWLYKQMDNGLKSAGDLNGFKEFYGPKGSEESQNDLDDSS